MCSLLHIFENLDYYYQQGDKYIPHEYTVKEIAVAKTEAEFTSGNLMGYEYVVTGNANEGFTITNTLGEIEVDLQKFGTNYSSPQDGAIFDLYSDTQENNEITWSVEQAGIAVNNSSDVHELKLESGL